MRAKEFGAGTLPAALALCFFMLAAAAARAQTPPPPNPPLPRSAPQPKAVTGFVSPYEIIRTVRAAGFRPQVRPLREGSVYVLRATDFRGILMRVVLDARTGAIRDVNRIVSADGSDIGVAPPYGPPPYYQPPGYGSAAYEPPPDADAQAPAISAPAASALVHRAPATIRPFPPLPRPRPARLARQKPAAAAAAAAAAPNKSTTDARNDGTNAPPPAASGKSPPVLPFND